MLTILFFETDLLEKEEITIQLGWLAIQSQGSVLSLLSRWWGD